MQLRTPQISWNVLTGADQDGGQVAHHLAPIPDIMGHGLMAAHAMTNGNIRIFMNMQYSISYISKLIRNFYAFLDSPTKHR